MSTHSILLVEDNPRICVHIEQILRTAGYAVTSSKSPAEFFDAWSARRHSLYLVDLRLGEEDGSEIIDRVRTAGDETPALVLSAECNVDAKVTCL
ncbi:response regulator [uncultured Alsobacter sp.]|uniref:response regulator n=1 Tax=uncultured Alsobacter sp. TaxID=1748258 RepID=UPI0025DEA4BB|nr:response regulator [uncultured Alsobacter sp.]